MRISVLKGLRLLKSLKSLRNLHKSEAETSESRAVSNMDALYENQPADYDYQSESQDLTVDEGLMQPERSASEIIDEDIAGLKESFSELSDLESISQLPNPTRYAALRDLGLTPEEAYMATGRVIKANTKSHLTSSVPRAASTPAGAMTRQQLSEARGLFADLSDNEIQRLYKRVNN